MDAWRAKKAREHAIAMGRDPDAEEKRLAAEGVKTRVRPAPVESKPVESAPVVERAPVAEAPRATVERAPLCVRRSESRVDVSRYDDELTMEKINETERAWRENHAVGDGEWKN
jgi:hypothetical protein